MTSTPTFPQDIINAADSAALEIHQQLANVMGKVIRHDPVIKETIARAIMAERERDQWMPIKTAPKDGTEIVALDAMTGTSHVTHYRNGDWHDPDSHYYSEAPSFIPFYWMPLPAPPKSEA